MAHPPVEKVASITQT